MSIKLSPKYGVNPTITKCFWCGKDKNEIALLGKLPKDAEAPKTCIINYDPCDECKANFSKGVLIMEGTETPNYPGQPKLGGAYPTGSLSVVKPEALTGDMKPGMKVYMTPEDYRKVFGGIKK